MNSEKQVKYRRIFVTSSKGGVGKSTVCANLAYAFAAQGLRTLVIDLDLSNRSLDMLFGCDSRVLYDIGDVIADRATPKQAVLRRSRHLFFVPGYARCDRAPSRAAFEAALVRLEAFTKAQVVLIDTSGSADGSAKLACRLCDAAIIVSNESAVSVRAAECSALGLSQAGMEHLWLVINRFQTSLLRRDTATVSEIIDRTRLPIIGLVPHSDKLAEEQEYGRLVYDSVRKDNCCYAFRNIARRFLGDDIPLFEGFSRMSSGKKRFLLH